MKDNTVHPTEEQLLDVLLHENGDDPQVSRHLEGCRPCREYVSSLEKDLAGLRNLAERFTPPARFFDRTRKTKRKWRVAPAAVPVFGLILLVVLVLAGWPVLRPPGDPSENVGILAEIDRDRAFLKEIESLEKRAYEGLSAGLPEADDAGFSEAFVDYVAPLGKPYTGSRLREHPFRGKTQTEEIRT